MKPLVFALALTLAAVALPGAYSPVRAQAASVVDSTLLAGLDQCIAISKGATLEAAAAKLGFGPPKPDGARWLSKDGADFSLRFESVPLGSSGKTLHQCGLGGEPPLADAIILPRLQAKARELGLTAKPAWVTDQGGRVTEFGRADESVTLMWVQFDPSPRRPKGLSVITFGWVTG